jgi:hypothetical protein
MDFQDIEKEIAQEFDKLGIGYQRDFIVPVRTHGNTNWELDFYINFPIRGFVELNLLRRPMRQSEDDEALQAARKHILESRAALFCRTIQAFQTAICPFLVVMGKLSPSEKNLFGELPVEIIEVSPDEPNPGVSCARKIRNLIQHGMIDKRHYSQEPVAGGIVSDFDVGRLGDVLISFRPLMEKADFSILEREISEFNAEFDSKHFTSGALRIGRTLEFIVYILARSWNVNVNKVTIKIIEDLRNSFDQLSSHLIVYVNTNDDQKIQTRKRIQKYCQDLTSKINDLAFGIDGNHDVADIDVPININSILRDIRKTYSHNTEIRNELDILINENIISNLLQLRNRAAHADTSGKRKEFEEHELENMVSDLREILFHMANIAGNIGNIDHD